MSAVTESSNSSSLATPTKSQTPNPLTRFGGRLVDLGQHKWLPIAERHYVAVAALIMFVPAFVGSWRPSLWEDELATWSAAERSWSQLWKLLNNLDAVAAPYYLLIHGWVRLFGDSELSLRFPSVLAISAAAGFLAVLARRLFSVRAALLTAVLFAMLPGVSRIGQEARVTPFAVMFTILATLALVAAVQTPSVWRWFAYGAALVGLGAANLVMLLLLVVHFGYVGVRWWRNRSRSLVGWILAVAGALVLLAPLMYLSHGQAYQLSWVESPSWKAFFLLPDMLGSAQLGGAFVVLAVIGIAVVRRHRMLLAPWLIAPPLLLFAISVLGSQSYWVTRYLYFLIPAFVLLAACALSSFRLRQSVWIVAVLVGLAVVPQISIRSTAAHYGYNGPAVERYLDARIQPGDVAVFGDIDAHGPRDMIRYYGPGPDRLPDILKVVDGKETGWYDARECADPAACLANANRIWMFRRDTFVASPFERMSSPAKQEYLRTNFELVRARPIGEVVIILLERRSLDQASGLGNGT